MNKQKIKDEYFEGALKEVLAGYKQTTPKSNLILAVESSLMNLRQGRHLLISTRYKDRNAFALLAMSLLEALNLEIDTAVNIWLILNDEEKIFKSILENATKKDEFAFFMTAIFTFVEYTCAPVMPAPVKPSDPRVSILQEAIELIRDSDDIPTDLKGKMCSALCCKQYAFTCKAPFLQSALEFQPDNHIAFYTFGNHYYRSVGYEKQYMQRSTGLKNK